MNKNIMLILLLSFFACVSQAQTPESINYQAAVRNSTGGIIKNQNVRVRINILKDSESGLSIYSETHSIQTSSVGLISLKIGEGDGASSNFSLIDWSTSKYFLKIEMDEAGGTNYTSLGISQLLSVPYALHSKSTINAKKAINADSATIAKSLDEKVLYFTDTDTLFAVKDRNGNIVFAVFPDGARVYVNSTIKGNVGGFAVSGRTPNKAKEEDFFIITQDSTRIYIPEQSVKGSVGGFAVSGRTPNKTLGSEYLLVNADSTRIYIPSNTVKGNVGGFAVSGRTPNKGGLENYMQINADSTRIFVKDSIAGFGIANLASGKAESFLNLNKQNYFIGHQTGINNKTGIYNIMLGYESGFTNSAGSYNTFLGFQSGYLNNASYNSFIGYLAGRVNTTGAYNTFIGYESGRNNDDGENNVFLGHQTGFTNTSGHENVFIGYKSGYSNSGGYDNIFIGNQAGENASANTHSTFIGNEAGRNIIGDDNICIGDRSGTNAYVTNYETFGTTILGIDAGRNIEGTYNTVLGYGTGSSWSGTSSGDYNVFVGMSAGMGGFSTRLGSYNVCLGNEAGASKTGSHKLYIANNSTTTLIYGEFDNNRVVINGEGTDNPLDYTFYVNGRGGGGYAWNSLSDKRLKKNIETIDGALDKVLQLRGVYFDWKDPEKKGRQIGFIAQETINILPEVVDGSEEKTYSMQYAPITAILVEALKEEHKKVDELEKQIQEIKDLQDKENKELKSKLEKLEKIINSLQNK